MKLSLSALKKLVLIVVGLIVVVLLLLWQALPRILQSQAEQFVADKTGHKLVMDRPEFNPFQLALRLGKLQLNDPDGKPLFGFDGLLVDSRVRASRSVRWCSTQSVWTARRRR